MISNIYPLPSSTREERRIRYRGELKEFVNFIVASYRTIWLIRSPFQAPEEISAIVQDEEDS